MVLPALQRLVSIVPPPQSAGSGPVDWDRVENGMRTALPADYKEMIETYGRGSFDGFLWVLQPSDPNKNLDLESRRVEAMWSLRILQSDPSTQAYGGGESVPYRVEEGAEEIIPWAVTDNGDICYWVARWESPDEWTVAVNEGGAPEWESFDGSATQFLLEVFSGTFSSEIFPEDFPSLNPSFTSLVE
jgi:hypothetical protein